MKREIKTARREERVKKPMDGAKLALLLCIGAVAGLTLTRMLASAFALRGLAAVLMQAAGLLLFALLPAILGLLSDADDRAQLVRFQALRPAQTGLYVLTGVLAVFPAALLGGVVDSLMGLSAAADAAELPSLSLFLPMLLCQALVAPVCEELFFRGYLLGVWERRVKRGAALAVSLLFALAHGIGSMTPVFVLLGLMLTLLARRADSVLAPMLAHAGYNAALVVLAFVGADGLLSVRTLPSCAVLLLGCAAFAGVLRRALALRPGRNRASLWDGKGLSRREIALLAGAALALIVSQIVGGLLA